MTAFEIMQKGTAAFKAKKYEEAEDYLLAAFQAYTRDSLQRSPGTLDPRLTVRCVLGKVYRATGRYEEAIETLEKALPNPGGFRELVSIFRFLAKVAKKDGDIAQQAEWYRRMFCLAHLNAMVYGMRVPNIPVAVDWSLAGRTLEDLRRQHGTIYFQHWTGEPVKGDTLLSASEYKALAKTNHT
jgi:tetratricopeptide (TPR) repeat protein